MNKDRQSSVVSSQSRGAFQIALLYLVIGSLWILLSDEAAARLAPSQAVLTQISIYKGWGYVLVTALLLYWIIQLYTKRMIKTESTLSENEKNYQELLQQASDGIFIADAQGQYILVNDEACRLVGYTKEELLSMNLRELVAPENLTKTPLRLDELCAGKTLITERILLRKDGSRILCEISAKQLTDGRYQSIIRDITERKVAEDAFRISEKRYRSLFENMTNGFARCQMLYENEIPNDFIYLDINDAFKKLTGLQDVLGKHVSAIIPGIRESNPELFEIYGRVASTGKPEKFETYVPGLGSGIWFSVSVYSTEKNFFVAVFETITERKQAEEKILASELRYRRLFESAKDGILILDAKTGLIVDVNPFLMTLLGYPYEYFLGKRLWELGFLKDIVANEENFQELLQKKYIRYEDLPLETTNGKRMNVEFVSNVYQVDHHKVIQCNIRDITERKQAEKSINESQDLFLKAFRSNPAAMVITRLSDGQIIDLNSSYEQIFEYTREELIGKTSVQVNIMVHPEERKVIVEKLQADGHVYGYETSLRTKSGKLISALFSIEMIEQTGEKCMLSSIYDFTERKRAEEELQRSNAELEQFAYVASHDLQEPLRAVAGMVQLLQQRYQGKLDERADEYIGHAVEAATRMQKLINDLLDYSRVGRLGKPFESTDSERSLNAALANLQTAIHKSNAQITHDPLPTLMADAGQLTQILQNLIGNAIKFRGAEPLHIHIGAKKIERAWQFNVSDNGIGIESKYYERIFLVFQRLHTRREYPGTGIGLALCKKIIERHSGQIWVESQPGLGATFYFTIPER